LADITHIFRDSLSAEDFDYALPPRPEPVPVPVQGQPDKPPIRILDMESLANQPAPTWVLENVIPSGLGFLIGAPAVGKSYLLLELANCICRGRPLLGNTELVPDEPGWVLAILPEGVPSWGARLRSYLNYHNLEYSPNFSYIKTPLNLADNKTWADLKTTLEIETERRGGFPPDLIIDDTLSASIPGLDENSQAAISPLTTHLQEWVTAGTAVIVSHHPNKNSDTYRGSSVLLGSCDWMLRLEQNADIRELQAVKLRDAEMITPVAFTIKSHEEGAIIVPTTMVNPWTTFAFNTTGHPGLREALLDHGMKLPDTQVRRPTGAHIGESGVPLREIATTWRTGDPINPTRAVDATAYKREFNKRETVLVTAMADLAAAGVLKVISGKVGKKSSAAKSASMSALIKQVIFCD